jgi:methionyl-tRNA formyltransferase
MSERVTDPPIRYAFAGDRDIAVRVLDYLLECGHRPAALLVSGPERASHAEELAARCGHLDDTLVFCGPRFREPASLAVLERLSLDLIIAVHFPYLVPPGVLQLPRTGVLNLHPAYLPYNRGWHTPSWAILDDTPIGATLHFMDEGIDTGDIVHRRQLAVSPADTADTLYARVKDLELDVFREAWPLLVTRQYSRTPQPAEGTSHRRTDLLDPAVQEIDLETSVPAGDLLRRLRALTTSRQEEAAYFQVAGKRYRIRIQIREDAPDGATADTARERTSG